jgi:hypothetical protein
MEAIVKEPSLKQLAIGKRAWSEATRFERYCLLSEIPGLAFGAVALIYVVTSLLALA